METIAARLVPSSPIDRHGDLFNAHPRIHAEGTDWTRRHLERANSWSAAQQAGILLADPTPTAALLALVRQRSEDVQALFWRWMNPFLANSDIRPSVARELAERGRPWSAMQVLVIHLGVSGGDAAARVLITFRRYPKDQGK